MLYTVKEVAEILKYNPETIKRMLRSGRLKGVKIGKEWRVEEENLNKFRRGE